MNQTIRIFVPAFVVGAALLMSLFYWLAESTSEIFWLLSIAGGSVIALLTLIAVRRYIEGTMRLEPIDLALRLAMGFGIFGLIGLYRFIGGVLGFAIMTALAMLFGALIGDLRYHLIPATDRPPTSRWFESPLLIRKLRASWALRLLAVLFVVEIALIAIMQSYTFAPCSWLDLTRRFQGCAGVIRLAELLNASAYAPNGTFAATVDGEGVLRVWSLPERKVAYTLGDYSSEIAQAGSMVDRIMLEAGIKVRFSSDSATLASSAPDFKIRLWNVVDGTLLRTLPASTDHVRAMAFSPDGTVLASASGDDLVRLWRVADGTLLQTLEAPEFVRLLTFSPDGRRLLAAEIGGRLHLWRLQDGTLERSIETSSQDEGVVFSPDGQLIAAENSQHQIQLWRVSDGTLARTIGRHDDYIQALAFSPDGTLLASGDEDVWLWRVSDGALVRTLDVGTSARQLEFSPDGTLLVVSAFRGYYFWRVR